MCLLSSCFIVRQSEKKDKEYHHYYNMFIESYSAYPLVCLRQPTALELFEQSRLNNYFSPMSIYFKTHNYWDDPCKRIKLDTVRPYYSHDTLNYDIPQDSVHFKTLKTFVVKGYYNLSNKCSYPKDYSIK